MMPRSAAIDPSMTAAPRHILPYAVFQQKNNRMEGNCYQQWWDFPKRVEVHASIISESHSSALPGVASPQTQWLVIVFTAVITAVVDTEPSPSSKILPNVYQISPKLFFSLLKTWRKATGNAISFWEMQNLLARYCSLLEAVRGLIYKFPEQFSGSFCSSQSLPSAQLTVTFHSVLVSSKNLVHVLDILYCM